MLNPEPDKLIDSDDDILLTGVKTPYDELSSDSDDDEGETDHLIHRSIPRRTNLGLLETVNRLRTGPSPRSYTQKIDNNTPLENHEQEQLIRDLQEDAEIMATVWRYLLIGCTSAVSILFSIFLLAHIIVGKNATKFHGEIEDPIGRGVFIVIQLLVVISSCLQVMYTVYLPIPSDELFIVTSASVVISTIVFISTLVVTHTFYLGSSWMPLLNAVMYGIVMYSEKSTSAIFSSVSSLYSARYRYEEI